MTLLSLATFEYFNFLYLNTKCNRSDQTFSSLTKNFSVFAAKLGHFTTNDCFLYVTNTKSLNSKNKIENEEKKVL
jgi:hypothetical protein